MLLIEITATLEFEKVIEGNLSLTLSLRRVKG